MSSDNKTGWFWDSVKGTAEHHINYIEVKAVLRGLESLCRNAQNEYILVQSANTAAVAYLNAVGGIKSYDCYDMAFQIWDWCLQN